ncbi:unnamed protein product [Paramecium sonneborni]|uniref:B box-type domain-containing protein n=1 Tax=Paramecium sonneborni TaxID=65129 RepID=A0A8S1LSK0_9CILI|nr:unnamed protein product [Paramecium sonneborni]
MNNKQQTTPNLTKNLSQQVCDLHKKQISGVCMEDLCKYSSRILCSDCQFTHQKCNMRMEIQQFQNELSYILNPELHKATCHYFPEHSKLLKYIDELFDKAKNKFKHHLLELEQKQLAFILQEQGIIINSNQSNRWAQQLINMRNLNLSKQEYDSAVIMMKEKQSFDKTVINEVKQTFDKFNILNKNVLEQLLVNFRLQNFHYDVQQLYDEAIKTLNKTNIDSFSDIEDKIKQNRFKSLSGGHESEASIVSITESPSHLISGSDTGNIVGWFKPNYSLDFRIKANEGLSALAVAKLQDQYYLFAGGQGIITAFSLQSKLKIFNLNGHTQRISKLQSYSLRNLISSSQDGTIKLWDLKERKYFKCFSAHQGPVSDFLLEKELITVGQDGQINWIDLGSQTIRKSTQFSIPIFCIGQIKQGKYVLGMGDGSIKILKGTKTRDYKVSQDVIYRLLALNNKQIVCYSGDGYLCVINLKKSSKIFKSSIQKDGQWQELCYIDKQLMIPHQGNIRVYQR